MALLIALAFHSLCFVYFDLFPTPPGRLSKSVFILDAKPYYFEKSSFEDKNYEFDSSSYKSLWLQAEGVSKITTADETGVWFEVGNAIRSIVIDGTTIYPERYQPDFAGRDLYERALNEVSALAWERRVASAVCSGIVWLALAGALIAWAVYLRKHPLA